MSLIYQGNDIANFLLFYKSLQDFLNKYLDLQKDGSILTEFYQLGGIGAAKRLIISEKSLFLFSGKELHKFALNSVEIGFKKAGFWESFGKGGVFISLKDKNQKDEKEATFFAGKAKSVNGIITIDCDFKATEAFEKFLASYKKFLNLGMKNYSIKYVMYFRNKNSKLISEPFLKNGPQELLAWNDEDFYIIENELTVLPVVSTSVQLYSDSDMDLVEIKNGEKNFYFSAYTSGGEYSKEKTTELFAELKK